MRVKINRIPFWLNHFANELKRDVDVSIIITGPKGNGKSTLTIWLMLWTQAYFNDGWAEVNPVLESLTWKADEWIKKMRVKYRYQAVGFEEFGNATSVEEVNNIINEMIRKVQSSNRFLNILKIFNVPGFVHVPPKVRNTMNFWINVLKKGQGKLYRVIPEEGPDQRPLKFYKENLGTITYTALPPQIYNLYKEIKAKVEIERYKESASKLQDAEFKKLPLVERRKRIAQHILELRKELNLEEIKSNGKIGLRWGIIAVELAKRWKISVSVSTLKRNFQDAFREYGWGGIEQIANS